MSFDWMSLNPTTLATIAVGMFVFVAGLLMLVLLKQGIIAPVDENPEDLARLKAAVEVALMTRKYVQVQREALTERMKDEHAKFSLNTVQDLDQAMCFTEERLNKAASLLKGPQQQK